MFFLDIFCFESQKCCFPQFSLFSVLYSISVFFLCFLYPGKRATLIIGNTRRNKLLAEPKLKISLEVQ